jgi:hypothetical protein
MALERVVHDKWCDALCMAGHRPKLFRPGNTIISLIEKEPGFTHGSRCVACGAYWPFLKDREHGHVVDYNVAPCPGQKEESEQ